MHIHCVIPSSSSFSHSTIYPVLETVHEWTWHRRRKGRWVHSFCLLSWSWWKQHEVMNSWRDVYLVLCQFSLLSFYIHIMDVSNVIKCCAKVNPWSGTMNWNRDGVFNWIKSCCELWKWSQLYFMMHFQYILTSRDLQSSGANEKHITMKQYPLSHRWNLTLQTL